MFGLKTLRLNHREIKSAGYFCKIKTAGNVPKSLLQKVTKICENYFSGQI